MDELESLRATVTEQQQTISRHEETISGLETQNDKLDDEKRELAHELKAKTDEADDLRNALKDVATSAEAALR